jgi:two-component system phosphate regulon response regulator PhoB/two-component system alkaline phosphatase synthesis response regulator PhoP
MEDKSEVKEQEFGMPPLKTSGTKTIVIVDDEPDIVELITLHLRKSGYRVKSFGDGEGLFKYLKLSTPDLVVLDLMLPDADGFEICQYLKKEEKFSNIPVIMLTARSHETDKILGLELGADDYVTKPFSPRELVARVKAVMRREEKANRTQKISIAGILDLDLQKYSVAVNGEKVELTSTEFKILRLLAERKGWVYSRDKILDHLGNYDKGVLDRTVDVHIKNLREKLGDAGKLIRNLRGVGYKIEEM